MSETATDRAPAPGDPIPAPERAFFVDEFAGATIVVALPELGDGAGDVAVRVVDALEGSGARVVLVVGRRPVDDPGRSDLADRLPSAPVVLTGAPGEPDPTWLAQLWLAITDRSEVVVTAPVEEVARTAAELAASLRATKLVVTDPDGGWGRPPRSFADVQVCDDAMGEQLAGRQHGAVVDAVRRALSGGVTGVNLCRAEDLDRELFTYDGAGTLFTQGSYVELGPLRVDDLPAVERLIDQGTRDGFLRPRTRVEVARLAVTGLGARVVGRGHLAGIAGLETDAYRGDAVGEVACLYTISRLSGAGAGGLLVDGLVERAASDGLRAVFAVTVSDAAAAFFTRKGFEEVGQERLPAAKWDGYDPARRSAARAFWRDTHPAARHHQPAFPF